MRSEIGASYFASHFTLEKAELLGDLLKVTYTYDYRPYVAGRSMTLILDTNTLRAVDDEVSTILLTPQSFNLDENEAVSRAVEQGLDPAGPFQSEVHIGPETDDRFAWWITGPVDSSAEAAPGSLMVVALDVETGHIYLEDIIGVDTNQ